MAIAQGVDATKVIACLDARMGEVYHATYVKHGDTWEEANPPGVYKPEEVPQVNGESWIGAGNGWAVYQGKLSTVYGHQLIRVMPESYPAAASIAQLSMPIFKESRAVPADQAALVDRQSAV